VSVVQATNTLGRKKRREASHSCARDLAPVRRRQGFDYCLFWRRSLSKPSSPNATSDSDPGSGTVVEGSGVEVLTESATLLTVEVLVAGVESRLVKVANCVPVGLTVAKTGDSSEVTVVPLPLPLLVATLLPPLLPLPLLLDGLAVATTDCVDICEPDEPSNPATSIPKVMKDWVFPLRAVANEFSPSVAMTSLLSSVPANAPETGVRVMVAATAQRRNVVANAAPVIYPPL
jgi:hypothetical protein